MKIKKNKLVFLRFHSQFIKVPPTTPPSMQSNREYCSHHSYILDNKRSLSVIHFPCTTKDFFLLTQPANIQEPGNQLTVPRILIALLCSSTRRQYGSRCSSSITRPVTHNIQRQERYTFNRDNPYTKGPQHFTVQTSHLIVSASSEGWVGNQCYQYYRRTVGAYISFHLGPSLPPHPPSYCSNSLQVEDMSYFSPKTECTLSEP